MGSYNQPCFVSKVTIGVGDRVYFIPLKHDDKYCPRNNTLSNTGEMFRPVMLPILGEYDDYGRVIPDKSDMVTFLERHYHKSIDYILDPDNKLYDAGVFVHESVYDAICSNFYCDYNGKKKEDYDFDNEFYWYGEALKKELKYVISSIKYFKQLMAEQPDQTIDLKGSLEHYMSQLLTWDFHVSGRTPFFKIWIRKFPELEKTFTKIFITRKLKDDMIKFAKFDYNLYCCNSAYIPTASGQQYGNHYMVREMLKAATKLNNAKIKKDKENIDD